VPGTVQSPNRDAKGGFMYIGIGALLIIVLLIILLA
jgi:hypothetical protein